MLDVLEAGLPAPAKGVFTTRVGGASEPPYDGLNLALHTDDQPAHVRANRELLERSLGSGPLVFGDQVHGVGVREVAAASALGGGRGLPDTDALWTSVANLALVMMGADCPPVLLCGDGVVGVAHVGRAGLVAGVLPALVTAMGGATSARIGPGICGDCYEVPDALADEAEAAVPGSRSTTRTGSSSIDLVAGATAQLTAAGVGDVVQVGGCTREQPERFFSYRRDGLTGRHGGVVWLP